MFNDANKRSWSRRFAAALGAVAALALMVSAVACDPEDAQPTAAPPTATAVATSPTPTQAPTATPEPTATSAPQPTATSAPTAAPTSTPTATPTATPTPEPTATPTPAPVLTSAQEVLDAAVAAMASVESGAVMVATASKLEGPFVSESKIEMHGDFQAPDRSLFTAVVTAGGFPAEYEYLAVGAEGYRKNPSSGEWESSEDPLNILGDAEHLGKLDLGFESEVVELITLVGVVDLDGTNAYYLKGALPAGAAADLVGDPSILNKSPDEPVETEIWISAEDFLARRVAVRYFQTDPISNTSLSGETVITFSYYGKEVDIQAP